MATDDSDKNNPNFRWEGNIPVFNSKLDQIHRKQEDYQEEDSQYKKAQLTLNERMVLLNLFLVIATVLGGGISAWQAHTASRSARAAENAANAAVGTLKEMQQSSSDTHELAVQAKNQADRTRDIAILSEKL